MDKKEFEFLLKQGEGLKLEFKENFESKSLGKEIVALANTEGGRIFIGVNDRSNVKGIKITNKLKSEIQDLARNCDPSINIKLDAMGEVLIVEVEEGINKPYRCSAGFFLRQGSNSQKLSTDEIREFFNKEGKILFDDVINKEFTFKYGFDKEKFNTFLEKAKISPTISDEAILRNIGVTSESGKFKNAGVLFFCKDVEIFFRQAIITCVLYKGADKTFIIDRKDFHSDIHSNYNDAMNFLRKNLKLIYRIEGFGPRKEILEIPDDALKEVIVNAIAHRDYNEKGANIQVDIFDDRVEISNPGGLIIREEEFGKKSRTRNPLIFNLLQRLNLVEKVGSGIGRIRDAMAKLNLKKPEFESGGFFTVTSFRPCDAGAGILAGEKATGKTRAKTREKILQLIRENSKITQEELAEKTKISIKGIEWNLAQLKQKGLLKRIGPDKGGHWEIKE